MTDGPSSIRRISNDSVILSIGWAINSTTTLTAGFPDVIVALETNQTNPVYCRLGPKKKGKKKAMGIFFFFLQCKLEAHSQ